MKFVLYEETNTLKHGSDDEYIRTITQSGDLEKFRDISVATPYELVLECNGVYLKFVTSEWGSVSIVEKPEDWVETTDLWNRIGKESSSGNETNH